MFIQRIKNETPNFPEVLNSFAIERSEIQVDMQFLSQAQNQHLEHYSKHCLQIRFLLFCKIF